eukprot:3760243-Prymnesium_polylepis.2
MAGLPGAGKSTVIERRYHPRRSCSTTVLDLDSEMAQHPRFNPADPDALYTETSGRPYRWADEQVEQRFQSALKDGSLTRIVIDGTGTNSERQMRRMREAAQAGWFVKVLYVSIPFDTAVRRAAHRARPVSAHKIGSYQAKITQALGAMADHADEFETFDAPSHDPPHVLMREGFVQRSRTMVHEIESIVEGKLAEGRRPRALAAQRA